MMTYRGTATAVHGMLFGVFFLLAVYAMLVELLRRPVPLADATAPSRPSVWQRMYLGITAALGWAAVLSGTFIVYPWYRAVAPAGADLHSYPKSLLLSHPDTAALHSIGMEWKEHVAFLAPIAFTMLAYVLCRYGNGIVRYPQLRRAMLAFAAAALLATGVAGGVGAMLNKAAPTVGAQTLPTTHAIR